MTLRRVITSWMSNTGGGASPLRVAKWAIRSEAPLTWRTFRDCKGWDGSCEILFFKYPRACLIFSPTPAKAEPRVRKEGAEMPLWRATREGANDSSALEYA